MGLGKTYSTKYLLDSNNNSGVAGQVLSTTSTGIDWVDANTVPGSGLWLANGNDIYNSNSADVGIGITNPSGKFHVYSGAATNNIYFNGGSQGGTGYDVNLYLNGGENNSEMTINMGIVGNEDRDRIKTYQGNMYFRTNDSERMTIDSGGDVTIQTSGADDIKSFTINSSNGSSQVAGLIIENDGANGYVNFKLGAGGGTASTKLTIGNAANSGNVGIGEISPDRKLVLDGLLGTAALEIKKESDRIVYLGTGTGAAGSDDTVMLLYHDDVIKVNVSTIGDSYFNGGNVGIGVTGPSEKLQVNQTNNDIYQLTLHNTHLSTTAKTRIGNWTDQVKISSNYMQSGGTKTQDNTAKASWVQTMGDDFFDISRSPAASTTLSSLFNIDGAGSTTITTDGDVDATTLTLTQTGGIVIDEALGYLNFYSNDPSTSSTGGVGGIAVRAETAFNTSFTPTYMSFYTHILTTNDGTVRGNVTERMRISAAGAIKFNSYGAGTLVSDASGNITVSSGGGTGGPFLPLAGGSMTGNTFHGDNVISYYGDSNDLVIVHDGSNAYLKNTISGNLYLRQEVDDADVVFQCDNGSGGVATYLTLDGSTTHAYFSNPGNVGIGYTAPDVKLVLEETPATIVGGNAINGSTMKGIKIRTNLNGDESVGLWFGTNGSHWSGISGQRKNAASTWGTTLSFYTHEDTAQDLTYSRERMIIDTGGNVGIGTSSPATPLTVAGNFLVRTTTVDSYEDRFRVEVGGASDSANVYVYNLDATARIRLNAGGDSYLNGGNVGINVSGPNARFQVQVEGTDGLPVTTAGTGTLSIGSVSGTPIASLLGRQTSNTTGLYIMAATSNGNTVGDMEFNVRENNNTTFSTLTRTAFLFSNFGTGLVRILRNGNVGINTSGTTSSTLAQLTINQDSFSDTEGIFVQSGNSAGGGGVAIYKSANLVGTVSSLGSNSSLTFQTNGGLERMRINSAGNVGIGMTSPAVPLDVEGKIRSTNDNSGSYLEMFNDGDVSGNSFIKNTSGELIIESAADITFSPNSSEKMRITSTGDIELAASSRIVLDDQPTASTASGSGTIVKWSVSTATTAGLLYVVISNGGWQTTDADIELRSIGMLGIALGSNATAGMLLQGFFYKSAHGFTIGLPLYISNTSGAFTTTRPTGTNDYVRIIGYATSANYIYFDPDKTWIKLT